MSVESDGPVGRGRSPRQRPARVWMRRAAKTPRRKKNEARNRRRRTSKYVLGGLKSTEKKNRHAEESEWRRLRIRAFLTVFIRDERGMKRGAREEEFLRDTIHRIADMHEPRGRDQTL